MSEGGQADGCYPRVNGGMIQSNQYTGSIVSLVGKVTGPETLTTADGTKVTINTEYIEGGLLVNPDLVIELIGQVQDPTVVNGFVKRDLSADMDLNLYNQMIQIQNAPMFAPCFDKSHIVSN